MKIKIITGQRCSDILELAKSFKCEIVAFPETEVCHSYTLCENVMGIIQKYYDKNKDLIIVTYSEIVLDAVRLWVARNKFEDAECINVLSDGNIISVSIDKNGEMEKWISGIFDIKSVILRELLEARREKTK